MLIISLDDYHRYQQLNTTAEMSPAELFVHPATASSNGVMNWDFPRMIASGALMTIGSDWGAVPDPSLLGAMAKIVETVGNGDKIEGGELLCRCLRSMVPWRWGRTIFWAV
jgi:predicted amidohydrolase YtcJ